MDDVRQGPVSERCGDQMDVVGHEDPILEPVASSVEMQQCRFDNVCDARIFQLGLSVASIQCSFNSLSSLKRRVVLRQMGQIFLPAHKKDGRQTVSEAKADHLRSLACFPVRQVAASAPRVSSLVVLRVRHLKPYGSQEARVNN